MSTLYQDTVLSKGDKGDTGPQGIPGVDGFIPIQVIGTNNITFSNTTSTGITNGVILVSNTLVVGSKYRFKVTGSIVKTSTLNSNILIYIRLNSANVITFTVALGSSTYTGNGTGFVCEGSITIRSVGSLGTLLGECRTNVGTSNTIVSNIVSTQNINTTINNTLDLKINSSVATTTGTIRSYDIVQIK